MLQCISSRELDLNPTLRDQMFEHRREEFCERLGWDLRIDSRGREIDDYDGLDPLYVILTDEVGEHLASGRLLPTIKRTMIGDVFSDIVDASEYVDSCTWEVTRVFVAKRDANSVKTAAALMWGGCHFGMSMGVTSFVSITPKFMTRVFGVCGWNGQVLQCGSDAQGGEICACRWPLNSDVLAKLKRKAGQILSGVSSPLLNTGLWRSESVCAASVASHEMPNTNPKQQHYG